MLLRPTWPFLVIVMALPITCGMAFAALPITRKRARVRWQHLRRATVYAFAISTPLAICIVLARVAHITQSTFGAEAIAFSLVTALIVMASAFPIVCMMYWWHCARSHLRLQHPVAAMISILLIGLLASVAMAYWLWEWTHQV
jgi:hypothetical protein